MRTPTTKTTVLMAVYNEEKFIVEALKSILEQTLQDFRLIIVDDGSTDGTHDLIVPHLRDSRIRLINQVNCGQAISLQTGLHHLETEYFLQLDGDDMLAPSAIEVLQREMEQQHSSIAMIYANYGLLSQDTSQRRRVKGLPVRTKYDVLRYVGPMVPRFYRASAVRRVGGWSSDDPFDGRYMEDKLLAFKLASRFRFHWIDRELYTVRRHGKNQTQLAIDHYARLKRWAVREALKKWRSPYNARFRSVNQWVYSDLAPKKGGGSANSLTVRPLASVIIPTRNRCDMLKLSLLSFYNQTADPKSFEVIVVDDSSSDNTPEMLRELHSPFPMKVLSVDRRSYSVGARNIGIRHAQGEVIIFSDADHIVPPNFVEGHWSRHLTCDADKTVTGLADSLNVFTCWQPGFNSEQEKTVARLIKGQEKLEQRIRESRERSVATFIVSEIDILSGTYQDFKYVPQWTRGYTNIRRRWGNSLRDCPTPWLFFSSRNQSLRKRTLERVGLYDRNLKRMGCWELGLRLQALGVGFEIAPELEGYHQMHPRDLGHQINVNESYCHLHMKHPRIDVYLLRAYLLSWIDLYQVATLSAAHAALSCSTRPERLLASQFAQLAHRAAVESVPSRLSNLKGELLKLRQLVAGKFNWVLEPPT